MKAALLCIILLLAGCVTGGTPAPRVVVAPTGPATAAEIAGLKEQIAELRKSFETQRDLAQLAAGAVYGATEANKSNPAGLPKEATAAQLEEAARALPSATDAQKLEKANQNARILAGELVAVRTEMGQRASEIDALKSDLSASEKRAAEIAGQLVTLTAKAEKERADAAAKLQAQFDDFTKRINAMRDEANAAVAKQQVMWLNRIGAAAVAMLVLSVGLASVFGGIAALRSVAPLAALLLITALACFGLAQVVGAPWFKYAVLGSLAVALGVCGWWAWSKHKADTLKADALAGAAKLKGILTSTVPVLDKAYSTASEDVKKFMDDHIFTPLNEKMDAKDKAAVHELRAELESKP